MNKFRRLKADEIEVRVGKVKKDKQGNTAGFQLLLYKDARVDQNILDETVGPMNWKKDYQLIDGQLFCTIYIWDDDKREWIGKQDVGVESNAEEEKGRASDAQKRAGFCFGIGRELYTTPFIWVSTAETESDTDSKFKVLDIGYDEAGHIRILTIINSKTKDIVWTTEKGTAVKSQKKEIQKSNKQDKAVEEASLRAKVIGYVNRHGFTKENVDTLCKRYKVSSLTEMNAECCRHYIEFVETHGGKIDE